ncbi:hypothetical protein KQ51_00537 [Candidatus Izimaplasma bacterium HR1]|jgi:fatty acid-binding protein DegV|uniref:DegV family protein n=1 Tax=Candidatus Izimoplasma sp. HR1 TaxID=1541959 RepID=UPI0004F6C422|nr:hypothetical protein KQ51_00537 [Candidatus Izimaplasma bacterium HR1]
MKIAYIVDGSIDLSPSTIALENVYSIPFKGYDQTGELGNIENIRLLEKIQKQEIKQYIEPTPGIYRDLYKSLKRDGYDYIVCIPQKRNISSSYMNAEYASRFCSEYVLVIDASDYELDSKEIFDNLLNDKEIKDYLFTIDFSFDQLFEGIRKVLGNLKLLKI